MKIAVIACNGRVGRLIVEEALNKGYDVVGFGTGENKSKTTKYINKNALDLTQADLSSFDAVVDAVGGWTSDTIPNITNVIIHLADILSGTNVRLYVSGGAGSLFVNKERTLTVDMGPDFPNSWKPLSKAHGEGLAYLRKANNLNWTYISPACNFIADGAKTGEYQLGGEELILNKNGESTMSYADFALAFIDVIESGKYNKERISVNSK